MKNSTLALALFPGTAMRIFRIPVLVAFLALALGLPAWSAETPTPAHTAGAPPNAHAAAEHHALPASAVDLFKIGPLPVTNSMVVTWAVAAFLIGFATYATRNLKPVP